MKLRDWLIERGITQAAFAQRLDLTRSHFSCIVCGARATSRRVAAKIEKETRGEISFGDVMSGEALGYEGKIKRALKYPLISHEKNTFIPKYEKVPCRKVFSLI